MLNCLQGTPWLTQTISSRDGRGRITAENSTISGTTVLSESLGWRNDDRLSSYTASGSLTVSGTASTLNYAYDTRGQIQTEPYQLTPTSLQTETYLFDATVSGTMSSLTPSSNNEGGLGVRTVQWRSPVGDNVANAQNTFAQVTQDNFNLNSSYDQVGNVTSWGPSGSAKTLTWDSFNRLVQVVSSSGTWTATYDGLGRRVQTKNGAGSTITYFYDPQVEFLQLGNNNGGSRAWNVYGPDRSGVYGGMQGVGGLEAVITEGTTTVNGVTNDYFGDALAAPGSTTRFSAVVGGYGAMPGSSAVNSSLQAQWRGEYIDPTGLYYMGARYYEPNSGRFLSADPLGHAASMDLYSFAAGDPVNGFDPDGRVDWTLLGRSLTSFGSGSLETAGGLTLASTGVGSVPGAVVAGYGAYQVGGNAANIYNAIVDAPAGPTGPAQAVADYSMLSVGVNPMSQNWNRGDFAGEVADTIVPTVAAGGVDTRLITTQAGLPGTLMGTLDRVYIPIEDTSALAKYTIYADQAGTLYDAFQFGKQEINYDLGNSAGGTNNNIVPSGGNTSAPPSVAPLEFNVNGTSYDLSPSTGAAINPVTPPSGDPLSAQISRWK